MFLQVKVDLEMAHDVGNLPVEDSLRLDILASIKAIVSVARCLTYSWEAVETLRNLGVVSYC